MAQRTSDVPNRDMIGKVVTIQVLTRLRDDKDEYTGEVELSYKVQGVLKLAVQVFDNKGIKNALALVIEGGDSTDIIDLDEKRVEFFWDE